VLIKNSNDTIENRTRGLLNYSAVSQPTAPPRAPATSISLTFVVGHERVL